MKNFKCNILVCGKAFSRLYHVQNHINNVHKGLKNYKCDLCDKAFGLKGNLMIHINSVHEKLQM